MDNDQQNGIIEEEKKESKPVQNRIGRDFTFLQLLKFAFPAILTTLFAQLFKSIDDGLFVSRYVGPDALASISLLNPVHSIIMAFSQLFAVGASTLSAQTMGKHDQEEAKRIFSRIVVLALTIGSIISILINIFCDPLCRFLGADDTLIANSRIFVRIVLTNTPITLLTSVFSSYYSTAGKPQMGLVCSIVNGAVNIILDIILIPVLKLGVVGSSLSTALGELAVAAIGFTFYSIKSHEIHFVKPHGEFVNTFKRSWSAGFSQFINSISFSVTNFVTNKTLLSYLGSNGISANSIISDLRIILNAAFLGYVGCVGPIIAYNYGEKNPKRLKKILSYNLRFWFFGTLIVTVIGEIFRSSLVKIFFGADPDPELYAMTMRGLTIEFLGSMFTCGCIFVMRMFVALGNPKTSSILTFSRNFIFRLSMMLLLPWLFGEIGIWSAFPIAEFLSFSLGATLVILNANNYGYGKSGLALKMSPDPPGAELKI